jgi:hypothetical protein
MIHAFITSRLAPIDKGEGCLTVHKIPRVCEKLKKASMP